MCTVWNVKGEMLADDSIHWLKCSFFMQAEGKPCNIWSFLAGNLQVPAGIPRSMAAYWLGSCLRIWGGELVTSGKNNWMLHLLYKQINRISAIMLEDEKVNETLMLWVAFLRAIIMQPE